MDRHICVVCLTFTSHGGAERRQRRRGANRGEVMQSRRSRLAAWEWCLQPCAMLSLQMHSRDSVVESSSVFLSQLLGASRRVPPAVAVAEVGEKGRARHASRVAAADRVATERLLPQPRHVPSGFTTNMNIGQ
ncbi:unnamed protein product [Pleuronectes platessa]|uniref:Uncharacterized protein n=1 Tax=Pleuronectes platessa TaxID=8262 RepID=A0A9N7YJ91_PLEPL|nr:unnamed protein product [Pleuronectes platessa]